MGARSRLKRLRQNCAAHVASLRSDAEKVETAKELVAMGVMRRKDARALLAEQGLQPDPALAEPVVALGSQPPA